MMPALLTTVPLVLNALVSLAESTLPGVTVYDGPNDEDNLPAQYIAIGYSRDEDDAAVDGGASDDGNRTASEGYSVHCIISTASGDTGGTAVSDRRTATATLFSQFAAVVRADPQLAGTLTAGARADIGDFAWIYGPSRDGGTYAEVEFDVNVVAYYLGAA
jgi:hypothetical protein